MEGGDRQDEKPSFSFAELEEYAESGKLDGQLFLSRPTYSNEPKPVKCSDKTFHFDLSKLPNDKKATALNDTVPEKINQYNLGKNPIGAGQYGWVFKATNTKTNEEVAMKIMAKIPQSTAGDNVPSAVFREIFNFRLLKHPNIVEMIELIECKHFYAIVMPMYKMTLRRWIEKNGPTAQEAEKKNICKQLLEALNYIHMQHMMHRDLKPENIMMKSDGTPIIIDLGLCREFGALWQKPFSNEVLTMGYRPPEIVLGCKLYDKSIDVWSLGAIMFEIYTLNPLIDIHYKEKDGVGKIKTEVLGMALLWDLLEPEFEVKSLNGIQFSPERTLLDQLRKEANLHPRLLLGFQDPHVAKVKDLIKAMVMIDPKKRISLIDALDHRYFKESQAPPPTAPNQPAPMHTATSQSVSDYRSPYF